MPDNENSRLNVSGTYYAKAYFDGDGETDQFSVPFPFLAKDHVHVFVNNIEVYHEWNTDGTVILPAESIPAEGDVIEIRRVTPRDQRLVQYSDHAFITAHSLNLQDLQFLFLFQEDMDALVDIAIGAGSGGSGDGPGWDPGPGGGLDPVDIDLDDIRRQLLEQLQAYLEASREDLAALISESENRVNDGLNRLRQEGVDMFRQAGFNVDSQGGTLTFAALEDLKTQFGHRFTDVYARLDAQDAALSMGSSTVVAKEILRRITTVEALLDSANGQLDLRIQQAEKALDDKLAASLKDYALNLDAAKGEIVLQLQEHYIHDLEERLTRAEIFLRDHGAELGSQVLDYQGILDKIDLLSAGLIENAEAIANAEDKRRAAINEANAQIAFASESLYAKIEEDGTSRSRILEQTFNTAIADQAAAFSRQVETVNNKATSTANSVTTLTSKVNNNTASIQSIQKTVTDINGKVLAEAVLNLDANKRCIGYKMTNDGKTGVIAFTADKFYIYSPGANANLNPFYYNANEKRLYLQNITVNRANINGLDAAVASIADARIKNAKITQAQIQDLKVTGSLIVDGSITTPKLAAGAVTRVLTGAKLTATGITQKNSTTLSAIFRLTIPNCYKAYKYIVFTSGKMTTNTNSNGFSYLAVESLLSTDVRASDTAGWGGTGVQLSSAASLESNKPTAVPFDWSHAITMIPTADNQTWYATVFAGGYRLNSQFALDTSKPLSVHPVLITVFECKR